MGLPPVVPTPVEGGDFTAQFVMAILFAVAIAGWAIRWAIMGLNVARPPLDPAERVATPPQGPEHGSAELEQVGARTGGGAG
jgi:hypothetical protein